MKSILLFFSVVVAGVAAELPSAGLMLDLDAAKGLTMEDGDRVAAWRSEVPGEAPRDFIKRDLGREVAGSGRPQ